MKQGKRPTMRQKAVITAARLNPEDWLVYKALPRELHIEHRETGKSRVLRSAG